MYSVSFGKPNNIRIRIRSPFSKRIIFVFVFGHQNTIRLPLTSLYIFQRGFPQSLCFSCKGFSPVFMLCKVFLHQSLCFFFMFFFTSLYVVVEPSLVLSVPLGDPIAWYIDHNTNTSPWINQDFSLWMFLRFTIYDDGHQ